MAFLELDGIYKTYYLDKQTFPVLKGINLQFKCGEFVSILGESGGGKSTLMNIIGGLDRDFRGKVIINGKELDHHNEKQLDNYRRSMVGYIYQSYNLISHLTVLDNVLVALDMTTMTKDEKHVRALKLLDRVGLHDQITKHPNQLSGGQKQRVAIARALASDPQIIIADEPTGALDSQNTQEVLTLLDQIAKDGKLVIAVTHSTEVAQHGTRVIKLVDGKIADDQQLRQTYPLPNKPAHIISKQLPASASYRMAFKHLMYNLGRNSLIMLGTAIGIFAVLLFSGLGHGVNGYVQNQVNSLTNPRAITVFKNPTGKKLTQDQIQTSLRQNMSSNPQSAIISHGDLKQLSHLSGIESIQKGTMVGSYQLSYGKSQQNSTNMRTWNKAKTTSSIKYGHKPLNGEIVLTKQQAIQLTNPKHYRDLIGKKINVKFNWASESGTPIAISTSLRVAGLSDGASANTAINSPTFYKLLKSKGGDTRPNFVALTTKDLSSVNKIANNINSLRNSKGKRIFAVITVGSILKTINTYVSLASTILAAIAGISLIVSALMIIVTMYMSVSERTKEIGILRALGERKKDIRRLFTSESVFIGLFSAILALIIVVIASTCLNRILYGMIKYNIVQITFGDVIFAIVIAIVIAFIAALMPARHAAKLNPIDALSAN